MFDSQVIVIDADVTLLHSVRTLHDHFREMNESQCVGIAPELSNQYIRAEPWIWPALVTS